MFDFIKNVFFRRNGELEQLKKENQELKAKLAKKQEDINKTNAYWKKTLHKQMQKFKK